MNVIKCEKCKTVMWDNETCHCKPFKVLFPEWYGDEPKTVYGYNFENVVERIGEKINEDDSIFDALLFDSPIEVTNQDGVTKIFNCTASISIDYHAKEIKEG